MTTNTTPQERIEAVSEPTAKERMTSAIKQLGLTFEYKFVPFSQSRNKAEKSPSLNWNVTLKRGNSSMSFDYDMGCAYCPSYKQLWDPKAFEKQQQEEFISRECEHGFQFKYMVSTDHYYKTSKAILPGDADIINSLALEASVLDSGSFEEWATEFGYDTDSRSAEAIYNDCLQQALQFRRLVGDEGLRLLQEASQDY